MWQVVERKSSISPVIMICKWYVPWCLAHDGPSVQCEGNRGSRETGVSFTRQQQPLRLIKICYRSQVQMLTTQNSISQRQLLEERKVAFNQRVSDLGRRRTYVPLKPTLKTVLDHEPFKGKGRSHLSQSLRKVARIIPATNPMHARSSAFVIFLQILCCSHSLFTRLLKGQLGKRSGHLLITQSSFLFL